MRHAAAWARQAQAELGVLLNDWDPLDVLSPRDVDDLPGLVDEYDGLRDRLLSRLLRGAKQQDIAAFLTADLAAHFGIAHPHVPPSVVARLFEWWESVT
ncbi:hypothetical protein [Nocardioides sp.]|uniref:hypothetical protein n=1 Tax=Nocardioides sp. TaxID=35761 RepID=UPI00261E8537|nr:hypothetical protein [Nocardioides sp.]